MRILMLSDYFPPHIGGGVEKVVEQLSSQLARRGHDIRVLTLRTRPAPLRESIDGVHVSRVPATDLTGILGIQTAWSWRVFPAVSKAVRQFKPEIIHAHNLYFRTTECLVATPVRGASKVVTTIHLGKIEGGSPVLRAVMGAYERTVGAWIVRRSDRLIAVSTAVADHVRSLGARAEQVDVIPNGVDLEQYRPSTGSRRGPPRVLFVGRLVPNKGPEVLVRAAGRVVERFPEAQFVVCGDGPMRRSLERDVARAGLANAFKFTGMVHDIPEIMREGSVLVRPSTLEGMPLSVLEAMASGLPVIATRVGGTPELVRDGVNGFLFNPGDDDGLARLICTVLADPAAAARMGAAARRTVESGWSWAEMARNTEITYERATSQPARESRAAVA